MDVDNSWWIDGPSFLGVTRVEGDVEGDGPRNVAFGNQPIAGSSSYATSFAKASALKKATKAGTNCFSLLGAKGFVVFVSFC